MIAVDMGNRPRATRALTRDEFLERLAQMEREIRRRAVANPEISFVTTPAGLVVPASLARSATAWKATPPRRLFFGVRLTSSELLGRTASWDAVVQRLHRYSLAQVLDVTGRISAVLARSQTDAEIQKHLVMGIFGADGPRVWKAFVEFLEQARREGPADLNLSAVVFEELQLVTVTKVAFLTSPPNRPPLKKRR